MSITLTEKAAQRVRTFLENRGKGIGLRLGVKTSGCSGLGYVLEFVDVLNDDDLVFEQHGVKVVVDPKSLVYLDGIELDYVKEGLNEGSKPLSRFDVMTYRTCNSTISPSTKP